MKELILGTGNPAKLQMVQSALKPSGIHIVAAEGLGGQVEVQEDGKNAQENARKKAVAYSAALGKPVLSIDNALYLDGLSEEQQPGVNTRRVGTHHRKATDEELLEHYTRIVAGLGGQVSGRWEFGLCIADPGGKIFEKTILSFRMFVAIPSKRIVPGYPLESIQIDPRSGKYVSELTSKEQDTFWQEVIGRELSEFVDYVLGELSI